MAVKQGYGQVDENWPTAAELSGRFGDGKIAVLPDRVEESGEEVIAAFRRDTQELRVSGQEAGLEVELVSPAGARLGIYEEHAADWILPTIASFPLSIAGTLVANMLQARIDTRKAGGEEQAMPVVRYQEVEIDGERTRLREIEGPADEVRDLLRQRADGEAEADNT
jgi:hypothetical protein